MLEIGRHVFSELLLALNYHHKVSYALVVTVVVVVAVVTAALCKALRQAFHMDYLI